MAAAAEQAIERPARDMGTAEGLARGDVAQRLQSLGRALELEVIPRLVLARRAGRETARPMINGAAPTEADVLGFAGILLTQDADAARAFVGRMHAHGAPIETVYLDLLAPTARWLGEMWCQDTCNFTDVTLGLSKLHRLLYELAPAFRGEREARAHGRRILLAPVPGEQHSFGLTMVAEFFRRAAWDVADEPGVPVNADLIRLVRAESFDIVGLSIASDIHVDGLARGIRSLRRTSREQSVRILVGGPLFLRHPELVARVGADATAIDGCQATVQADNLLRLLASRS